VARLFPAPSSVTPTNNTTSPSFSPIRERNGNDIWETNQVCAPSLIPCYTRSDTHAIHRFRFQTRPAQPSRARRAKATPSTRTRSIAACCEMMDSLLKQNWIFFVHCLAYKVSLTPQYYKLVYPWPRHGLLCRFTTLALLSQLVVRFSSTRLERRLVTGCGPCRLPTLCFMYTVINVTSLLKFLGPVMILPSCAKGSGPGPDERDAEGGSGRLEAGAGSL